MLLNLALISALLASVVISLVLSITTSELDALDRYYLASRHYLFRQHFAPETTLDPCQGEMTPEDIASKTMSDYYRGFYYDMLRFKCDDANMAASRFIYEDVKDSEMKDFVEANMQGIVKDSMWALPSYALTVNANDCAKFLMSAICVAVFQYYSLMMSTARRNPEALSRWWNPVGLLICTAGYLLVILGLYSFLNTLECVIMVRRSFTLEAGLWSEEMKAHVVFVLYRCLLPITVAQTAYASLPFLSANIASVITDLSTAFPRTAEALASGADVAGSGWRRLSVAVAFTRPSGDRSDAEYLNCDANFDCHCNSNARTTTDTASIGNLAEGAWLIWI